jgi:DNA-directed RNA polymerase subunit E'/Rpb7
MLRKSTQKIRLKINYSVYKNNPEIINILKNSIHEIYSKNRQQYPVYLGFSDFSYDHKMYFEPGQCSLINVDIHCKIYYYKLDLNELVLAKIKQIDQKGTILLDFFNLTIYIPKSQIAGDVRINALNNSRILKIDNKILKINDVIKLKIVELSKDKYSDLKIKGSIKGISLGKLSWFTA